MGLYNVVDSGGVNDPKEAGRLRQAQEANGVLQKAVDVSSVLTRAQSPCSYKRCPCV